MMCTKGVATIKATKAVASVKFYISQMKKGFHMAQINFSQFCVNNYLIQI